MPYLLALLLTGVAAVPPSTCSYNTWTWSVSARRAVGPRHVSKPYAHLTSNEKAPDWATTGCTLCSEDQQSVVAPGMPAVLVCRYFAPRVAEALETAAKAGARINTLVGYRVCRSGGPVVRGKRTQFGWHAFGEALDINSRANGLYHHCKRDTPAPHSRAQLGNCRRRLGGEWRPDRHPDQSLTATGAIVTAFRRVMGWHWGGERTDTMKDFMHVSPDGY